jgi:5'-3' exoribonuclease 1
VTWRFPDAVELQLPELEEVRETNCDVEGGGEWEDVDDDEEEEEEESKAAVDRMLKKCGKAQVMDGDEGGGFDARYERSIREKMDEWKRGYYKVLFSASQVRRVLMEVYFQAKLEISYDSSKEKGDLVFRYVEGLQWVMHYYYSVMRLVLRLSSRASHIW